MATLKFLSLPTQLLLLTALTQAQTVTLSTSQNPSTFGAPVTLTATLAPSNATGRVTFYDGVTILGTKPLSTGTASLSTILLPSGARNLKAYYSGDSNNAAATSNVITQTVNAQPSSRFAVGFAINAHGLVVADFDGDGKADIANGSVALSILLGDGNGGFRQAFTNDDANVGVSPLAAADFNGDGKVDLVTEDFNHGKGDGSFQPPVTYSTASLNFATIVTGDFNGDGIADLAGGNASNTLGILLGNGDGTFQAPIFYFLPGSDTEGMVVGEFNGDGKTDLVTERAVLLGTTRSLTATGGTPQSTLIGTEFPIQLQATVRDGANPVAGAAVTFSTPPPGTPGVTLSSTTAITDTSGVARVTATANLLPGVYTVMASYQGLFTSFTLGNSVAAPASLTASAGTPQFAATGVPFPNALLATVKDSAGNPLSGITVVFTTPANGASAVLSSVTALTNVSGVASVTATANNIIGSYTVTASVGALSASFSLTNVPGAGFNLAVGKTATQSSTLSGSTTTGAASAVDGSTDGNFFHGSVTHTNADPNAWWQVDLGTSATISSIVIWGRTDCCSDRLSDYWVFVSNTPFSPTDTPATLQVRVGTFSIHQTGAPSPSAIIAASTQGRYVRVQLTGTNNLSLAEVQVLGSGAPLVSNLALGKIAIQSSTLLGFATAVSGAAVDGITDGNFFDRSVTHTNLDSNAWWQVDLGTSATINSIVIWNRTDCCSDRLNDYWVFVSDIPFGSADTPATLQNRAGTFSSHQTTAPNPSTTITIPGAQGRYVRIQLTGTNNLSLAEVQVFGTPVNSSGSNLAAGKQASQSSTLFGYPTTGPGSAVDGNTDGNFFDSSVTHTNLDPNAWWQVDLGASSAIASIVIWNRTDCCSTRLNDYWIFVSDTPFAPTDTPSTLQTRAGTFASHQTTTPSPSATIPAVTQGRYVRIQLTGTNNLSLAEVQVIGQ